MCPLFHSILYGISLVHFNGKNYTQPEHFSSTHSSWNFNSGASNQMTYSAETLTNVTGYSGNIQIRTGDGIHLPITAMGDR